MWRLVWGVSTRSGPFTRNIRNGHKYFSFWFVVQYSGFIIPSRRVLPGGLCPLVTLKAGAPAVLPPPLPLAYLIWFPPSLWLHYKLALLVKLEASAGCTAAFVRWLHYRPALLLYCRLCFRWFIL